MEFKMGAEYIPGVCNINTVEIQKRRKIGMFGAAASTVLIISILAFETPPLLVGALFVSAFICATGYLQAANKFCVGFAKAKIQRVGDDIIAVEDADALAQDKRKARKISFQAAAIALVTVLTVIAIAANV